jgi:hypothetical protein
MRRLGNKFLIVGFAMVAAYIVGYGSYTWGVNPWVLFAIVMIVLFPLFYIVLRFK